MNPAFRMACSVLSMAILALAASPELRPYAMEWRAPGAPALDLSFLQESPAGRDGFVAVKDGRLSLPGGRRFRIWGVNVTGAACTPAKRDAPEVAAHLARLGVNCVRFHFLDRLAPNGLIDAARADTRALDPAQLDRFDFFVSELKKRGIYSNLNLNVGRTYKAGDGVKDFELLGFAKALTYFDARLLDLQHEYARQLLTHRNPYTGAEYRNEPAVATVELVNENSIVESWFSNRLLGKNARKNPGTWTDIPPSYEKDLTARYHAWLARRGLPRRPRLTRDEFAAAPAERFRTEAAFYMEIERDYFASMRAFLKDELQVKPLLAGTSDHNHGASGYPLLSSTAQLDIVDGHVYWQHPRYLTDPATGRQTGFEIGNTPMVDDPLDSTVVQLSRSAVAGKPYTVSEVNHPFPAEHAAEGIPILAAYAAFHDWDGIYWYTFEHKDPADWKPVQPRHFELRPDPVKMTQIAAGALLFLRGGIRPAARTAHRSYAMEDVAESLRLARNLRWYFTPGFPHSLPLLHASRIAGFGGPTTREFPPASAPPYISDTGELHWEKGFVTLNAPRAQALIGRWKAGAVRAAGPLSATLDNEFAALTLVSLDGAPIATSARLLLSAGARAANTAMKWNTRRTSLEDWGTEPTLIEPVVGKLRLTGLKGARQVWLQPLSGSGAALGEPMAGLRHGDAWSVVLGRIATPWYELRITR